MTRFQSLAPGTPSGAGAGPEAPFHVRQGDVLVIAVDGIPADAALVVRDGGRVVLAYGEVTGHAHAIRAREASLLELGPDRYLRVSAPVTLEHEEHAAIGLPPGTYRVVIQREYVPGPVPASRRVAD
jgi:hypothetical protein